MATTCCFAAAAPCASCKQGAADNVTILVLQSVLRGLRRLHCQVFGLDLFDLCLILHHPRHSARRPCICRERLGRRLVVNVPGGTQPCPAAGEVPVLPSCKHQASTFRCTFESVIRISDSKAAAGHNSARVVGCGRPVLGRSRQPAREPDLLKADRLDASSLAPVAGARPLMLETAWPIAQGGSTHLYVLNAALFVAGHSARRPQSRQCLVRGRGILSDGHACSQLERHARAHQGPGRAAVLP